jgi:hypothetical protein
MTVDIIRRDAAFIAWITTVDTYWFDGDVERRLTRFRQTTTWSNEHEEFDNLQRWMGTLCTISQDIYRYTDESSDKNILQVEVRFFPDNFQLLELRDIVRIIAVFSKEFGTDMNFVLTHNRDAQAPISLKHLSAALLYKFVSEQRQREWCRIATIHEATI